MLRAGRIFEFGPLPEGDELGATLLEESYPLLNETFLWQVDEVLH